jgi:RHS repeat-associated protein
MYDDEGKKTWSAELDIYGRVRTFDGRSLKDCPFRFQGQYEDAETGLYYNRFRYYDPSTGNYLSQDPIGLTGGNRLYGYVHDSNYWVDVFGLFPNMNGATVTVTATSTRGVESATKSSGGGFHAEINALKDLNKKGALNGADVVISDVKGHFPGNTKKDVQVCAKCRHDIFQDLIDGKANSVTIPQKGGTPITVMRDQFKNVQKATGDVLKKYEGTHFYKKRSDESFDVLKEKKHH